MSDELKKMQAAFKAQDAQVSGASSKAGAVAAAMHAFEQEKIIADNQGNETGARLNQQGNEKKPLFDWRKKLQNINTKFAYGMMGSASIAVLALVVVSGNLGELVPKRELGLYSSNGEVHQSSEPNASLKDKTNRLIQNAPQSPQIEKAQIDRKRLQSEPLNQSSRNASRVVGNNKLNKQEYAKLIQRPTTSRSEFDKIEEFSFGVATVCCTEEQIARSRITKGLTAPANSNDITSPQYQDEGRDKFSTIETNPVKVTKEEPVSTFSVDVDTASYAFMRSAINNNQLPQKNAVRVEELINYFDYGYEAPSDKSEPFNTNVSIMPTPWNEGTKLMSIGIKGYEIDTSETPASNLVFLIDTSGSMHAPNKLPLLRNSFKLLLSSLKPDDTISIVTYAGSAGTVLEPTKAKDKNKILFALDRLHAGGSTAGASGIKQAYALAEQNLNEEGVNRVILATDGDFNVGVSNPEELKSYIERKRDTGVTLSVLGFGRGNYNDELMQTLAQNGNGNAAYIDTLSEARKVLVEEAGSTLFTIAKDVKLQVEFNPALVSEYRLIGYETRALNREDFNNDKVDAGDIGAGHTVTALYEITPANSEAKLVDDLRYGSRTVELAMPAVEYGFLKIRYKLPDSDESTLITRAVTTGDEISSVQSAKPDARFASAVAAYGQLLRGGQYTGDYAYDDVIELANSAKGEDEFGYRAEFINLVRLAKAIAGQ